jgi:hypothetical protein
MVLIGVTEENDYITVLKHAILNSCVEGMKSHIQILEPI